MTKEADVPKELMDCLLSLDERHEITSTYGFGMEMTRQIAEAQLAKVAPYIEAQVKAETKRILKELSIVQYEGSPTFQEISNLLQKIRELKQEVNK